MAQAELFEPLADLAPATLDLEPGARLLRGFAVAKAQALVDAISRVVEAAPLRHMVTARGWRMSVAMSNCGEAGWVSDRRGYRYDPIDPETGRPWPAMPAAFSELATQAAAAAGFERFVPDACLINRYEPGAKLSMHQDKNERDLDAPIVSVSLGLPATFLWGGAQRGDRPRRVPLVHGDVVVWGGPARLHFHGVDTLQAGHHPMTGAARFNLTLRTARAVRGHVNLRGIG
jgi:DNA oxidative demethylase